MTKDHIGYNKIVNKSMFFVIEEALSFVKKNSGFPGDHHFYITFDMTNSEVATSKSLSEQYPDEMTIVIQNWYEDHKNINK